jgi:AraC-like DNA-binding protein
MNYQTFEPHHNLSAFINCYWTLEAPKEDQPEKQRIVPDGCLEMIFHHGDLYKQFTEGEEYIIQPQCFVFGQITKPLYIEPTGHTGIFAVRFQADGFTPFAAIPIGDMENKAVPLAIVFGEAGVILEKNILQATTTEERIQNAEIFLRNALTNAKQIDKTIKDSVKMMLALKGQLSIDELSENLKVNRRMLERKFAAVIGVSPKQLSKIVRLQNTLKMLLKNDFKNFTAIAHDNHYYDQAHFIKEFKEFTGVSPKEFYSDNLKLSNIFTEKE